MVSSSPLALLAGNNPEDGRIVTHVSTTNHHVDATHKLKSIYTRLRRPLDYEMQVMTNAMNDLSSLGLSNSNNPAAATSMYPSSYLREARDSDDPIARTAKAARKSRKKLHKGRRRSSSSNTSTPMSDDQKTAMESFLSNPNGLNWEVRYGSNIAIYVPA